MEAHPAGSSSSSTSQPVNANDPMTGASGSGSSSSSETSSTDKGKARAQDEPPHDDALLKALALLLSLGGNRRVGSRETDPPRLLPFSVNEAQMDRLCSIIGVQGAENGALRRYLQEFPIALWGLSNPHGGTVEQTIGHVECLARLFGEKKMNVTDFYTAAKVLPGWPNDTRIDFSYAWDMFLLSVNLPCGVHRSDTYENLAGQLFGRPLGKYYPEFTITVHEMQEADIAIKATSDMSKHLHYKDGVVYLLDLSRSRCNRLYGLELNQIAQIVGIESLGREILASYRSLLKDDPTWSEAIKLGLVEERETAEDRVWIDSFIHVKMNKSSSPFLLASRERDIKQEILRRKKWWRMLLRDIQKQSKAQPVLFYGSMLAVFFGICAVVQTIASVWALVVTLKA